MATLTKEQKESAIAFIRDAVKRHKGNQSTAATELGISQQVVNRAINQGQIGIEIVRRMATRAGRTIAGQLPESAPTEAATTWVESTPRYMNLEVAVRRAKERGEPYPDDAVQAARILMRRDYDPPPEEWATLLSAHSKLASQFERRERLVLESEVAGPDPSIAASRRR